jgi:hypothetical protein
MTLNATNLFGRTQLERNADWLAIAVAASLPWSTSATGILVVLWLIAVIPTLKAADVWIIKSLAGGLPILLVLLGIAGMLWADVPFKERIYGLESFLKLLFIPLLFLHFRRSERGLWIFFAYLLSCCVILVLSTIIHYLPAYLLLQPRSDQVPVKNAATQSGEFTICVFGLLFIARDMFKRGLRWAPVSLLLLVLVFLGNMFYVATGRTALAVMAVLFVVLGIKYLTRKEIVIAALGALILGALGWSSSPYLRARVTAAYTDLQPNGLIVKRNSSTERINFARQSLKFIAEAPVIGHGTGSISSLFRQAMEEQPGAFFTTNPHNQTFAVAIQLGLIGAAVLWMMWSAHLLLFRGSSLVEWIGLVLVVQNIVGSFFNSHLFDFVQGWTYVIGVGVAGGIVMRARLAADEDASGAILPRHD